MFPSLYGLNHNLYLTLISRASKEKVKELDKNNNIIFFNPDYIYDPFQIIMGVNKGFYNIKLGRTKSKEPKKEIIHCMTNESKLTDSLALHDICQNKKDDFFIVFIDQSKEQIEKNINDLNGEEIRVENYSKFFNYDSLVKHFQIKENLEIKDIENGLQRAIYNRISTKELK